MPRSKSSKQWLHEHFSDTYVKKSKQSGLRSRAAYKLLAIQEKDKLFTAGMTVVDLGAAPGGWSQVAQRLVGAKGKVFAVDILSMDPIPEVTFIQGDFREVNVLQKLLNIMGNCGADIVISDMAPNITGNALVDLPKAIDLAELALEMAKETLKPEGAFIVKVFHGAGFEEFLQKIKKSFKKVVIRKPDASRLRSKEVYIVARSHKFER